MIDWTERRYRAALVTLAALAGVVVFVVGHEVFPYLSSNHDEGVYLQQASMLLSGNLWLTTDLPEVFQPWFFVRDGTRLYPKYTPVSALMFAPGVALSVPRLSLSLIAAGNVALVGILAHDAFDRSTGLLASAFVLATPFFLTMSSLFLSYAPTTLLNLTFAAAYVRTLRRESVRYAALAGTAIGLAFFSRPYTAFLFAVPFVAHALFVVVRDLRSRAELTPTVERMVVVAGFGLAGVGLTFAYNHVVTGDAFLFPYEAFAPLDGLGFGHRKLLGYEREYTVELALWATSHLQTELLTRWTVAAPLGSVLAAIGLIPVVQAIRERPGGGWLPDWSLRLLVVGVFVSVSLGNIYFWGSVNVLGNIALPTDGFMARFGPFYHFDLLLPLSVLGAAGTMWLTRTIQRTVARRYSPAVARAVVLVLLVVSVPVAASAEYERLESVAEKNAAFTEKYADTLAPFENQTFENALVFLPLPNGPWLNFPFQTLRNGGSLERGNVLYAQNHGPVDDFATIDTYPNRTLYRFTYRGNWAGGPEQRVTPHLQRLSVRTGPSHRLVTTVGVVGRPSSVRLEADGQSVVRYLSNTSEETVSIQWVVNGTHVRLTNDSGDRYVRSGRTEGGDSDRERSRDETGAVAAPTNDGREDDALAIDGPTTVVLSVTFVQHDGSTVTYRQELDVDATDERARLIWPAERKVCRLTPNCGHEGMYVPDGQYLDDVSVNATIETEESAETRERIRTSGTALRDTPSRLILRLPRRPRLGRVSSPPVVRGT